MDAEGQKRTRGRPKCRWRDDIKQKAGRKWMQVAVNHEEWKYMWRLSNREAGQAERRRRRTVAKDLEFQTTLQQNHLVQLQNLFDTADRHRSVTLTLKLYIL